MTFNNSNARLWWALPAVAAFALLGMAYFLEYGWGLLPCPLCQLQRAVLWVLAFTCLIAVLHGSVRATPFYSIGVVILALLGIALSSWQIWLQHAPPDSAPPCAASISALFQYYHFLEALKLGLNSQSCAKDTFSLLGLSLAQWSLLSFIGFFLFGLGSLFCNSRKK